MGSTPDTLIPHLQANGVLEVPFDVFDIDRRIKFGDESGWRGDPTMCLCINPHAERYEVWGIDRHGNEYMACSAKELDHRILVQLREGDPTRNDPWQKVLDHNAKLKEDQDKADRDQFAQVADKVQWGIRQDFGHLLGGRGRKHAFPDAPKSDLPKQEAV